MRAVGVVSNCKAMPAPVSFCPAYRLSHNCRSASKTRTHTVRVGLLRIRRGWRELAAAGDHLRHACVRGCFQVYWPAKLQPRVKAKMELSSGDGEIRVTFFTRIERYVTRVDPRCRPRACLPAAQPRAPHHTPTHTTPKPTEDLEDSCVCDVCPSPRLRRLGCRLQGRVRGLL